MSHTFTVTRIVDDPEGDSDDPEYTQGGTCDNSCSVWYPCKFEGCDADDEGDFHGVYHQIIGGIDEFCVEGDGAECGLNFAFENDNPEFQMTELGVYDVEVEWDGDWWIATLTLREPTNV